MNYEILPPVQKNGRESIVGVSIDKESQTITISHHTILIGETDQEKRRSPEDYKSVTFPFDQLKWLGPRLDGLRQFLSIENGYESKKQN